MRFVAAQARARATAPALGFGRKRLLAGRPEAGRAEHAHRIVEAKRAHGVSETGVVAIAGVGQHHARRGRQPHEPP